MPRLLGGLWRRCSWWAPRCVLVRAAVVQPPAARRAAAALRPGRRAGAGLERRAAVGGLVPRGHRAAGPPASANDWPALLGVSEDALRAPASASTRRLDADRVPRSPDGLERGGFGVGALLGRRDAARRWPSLSLLVLGGPAAGVPDRRAAAGDAVGPVEAPHLPRAPGRERAARHAARCRATRWAAALNRLAARGSGACAQDLAGCAAGSARGCPRSTRCASGRPSRRRCPDGSSACCPSTARPATSAASSPRRAC